MGFLTRAPRQGRKRGGDVPGCRFLLCLAIAAAACGPAESPRPAAASGGERYGSIVDLKGTMLLTGPGRPGVGFQSEVIGLTDSATGFQGRSVWTDERGDQVFSALQGTGTAEQNHITGTILSGTGRYAGLTGSYAFSWQWVMEGEEGAVHGRAVDLQGRVQLGPAAGGSPR